MTFGDKLKQIRLERRLTQEQLAEIMGTSKQVISRYENNQRTPNVTVARNYAKLLDVPFSFLADDECTNQDAIPEAIPMTGLVAVYGTIPAGVPAFAQENIEGYLPVMVKNPEEHFYLRVTGDSMVGAGIRDGSVVLLHKQSTAENGQIVACRVNGDSATLKRFKQIDNTIILMPENTAYEPIIVPVEQFSKGYAEILGVAKQITMSL